jgi:hypothetical protein
VALTDILPSGASGVINSAASSPWNPVNMVTAGRNYLDTQANNWLVKPATAAGISGFVFDVERETTLVADTDITDHFTEYNNFFQDHAAIRPLEVTLRGFVGELVQKAPQGVVGLLGGLQNKLTTIDALLGKYTPQAVTSIQKVLTKATNVVNTVDNIIGRAQNIVGLIAGGSPAPTKQEQAMSKLMALRDTRQVFTLVTPWGLAAYFDPIRERGGPRSFVIKRLVFEQGEETRDMSDIVVTLKEVRFATVASQNPPTGQTAQEAVQNSSGRAQQGLQGTTNKGKTSGSPSAFGGLFSSFGQVKQPAIGTV